MPPLVSLSFDTTQVVRSPGALAGVVNVRASGGLDLLQLRLATADSSFVLDTLEGFVGEEELARAVTWQVAPGLPPGTTLHFTARARDFIGFEGLDSVRFRTQP